MAQKQYPAIKYMTHRNGSHTLSRFRQGWTTSETGGSGANLRNCAHAFFDTDAINTDLANKIVDRVILRIPNTSSYGLTAGNYFRLHKSPFGYSEANASHLEPHDYYPGGDFSNADGTVISGYVDSPYLVRDLTMPTDIVLPADFLTHILTGKGIAAYNRTQQSSPTSSHHTRETNDAPVLIIEYHDANSAPTAPTSFTAEPALYESGNVVLAWSGETDPDGNIDHQEIEYAIKLLGGAYGAWIALKTATGSGTTTVPALERGGAIKYRTKTVDAAGVASPTWKVSNEVVKNSLPTAPTNFTAEPALYENGNVSLAWSGETDPNGNIAHQEIEYAIKPPGGSYGPWIALKTATGSGTTTVPTLERGAAIKYHTKTVDKLGAASATWKESNEVVRNSAPAAPTIIFPGAEKTTYNTRPYVGLSINAEPNGQVQTLFYSVDGGAAQNAGAVIAGTKKLQMPEMTAGNHTLRFWLQDSQGVSSAEAVVTITVAANTYTRAIAMNTLLWDEENGYRTSTEILELKSRVNQVRAYFSLAAISLPYEGTAGNNTIKHFHTWMANMAALYQGLADTCAVNGTVAPPRVTRTRNAPSAGVFNQVRGMIGSL